MKMEVEHWQCATCMKWLRYGDDHYCPATHVPGETKPLRQLTENDVRRIVREEIEKERRSEQPR